MPGHSKHASTGYISLNSRLCKACWACIEVCPQKVLDKIDVPFHKHVKITDATRCQGCLECVNACPEQALMALKK